MRALVLVVLAAMTLSGCVFDGMYDDAARDQCDQNTRGRDRTDCYDRVDQHRRDRDRND